LTAARTKSRDTVELTRVGVIVPVLMLHSEESDLEGTRDGIMCGVGRWWMLLLLLVVDG
jgi:hypothetical protein